MKKILFAVIFASCTIGLLVFLSRTKDPLDGQGPDLMSYLGKEKTICESSAQELQAKGIDGRLEYEKVQSVANGCIGYLQGIVDQGHGDQQTIGTHIESLQTASFEFRQWANKQLGSGGFGAAKGEEPLDVAMAFLKLVNGQEQARRKAVKESLQKFKFRSWSDLRVGQTGEMLK